MESKLGAAKPDEDRFKLRRSVLNDLNSLNGLNVLNSFLVVLLQYFPGDHHAHHFRRAFGDHAASLVDEPFGQRQI